MSLPVNKLREMIKSGKPTLASRLNTNSAESMEVFCATGVYDYMEFTAEYAPFGQLDLTNLARAAEVHGCGSIIKVDFQNRFYVAQKAVASGFQGILFTDHKTPEEVEETLYAMRADSLENGRFGMPSSRLISGYPGINQKEFIEYCNNTVNLFMIEKEKAVENIEAICKVKGVDMIQFGPADYSVTKGWNFVEHVKEVREVEDYCIRKAIENGVRPRAEIDTPEQVEHYAQLGVIDFCVGDEHRIIRNYSKTSAAAVRALINK